jgi:hypothetical protein
VQDLARVAAERAKQRAVAVHDDEAILVVALQQLAERGGVELVVTHVERRVDGLEGLKVDVDLRRRAWRARHAERDMARAARWRQAAAQAATHRRRRRRRQR